MVRKRLTWSILVFWLKRVRDSLLKPIVLVVTGQFSPTLATFVHQLQTRNPQTYVEKIRYKMARDRRPLLTLFADKVAVRDYVRAKTGPSRLSRVFSFADDFESLNWRAVPEEYVLKVNHGCRGLIIVTQNAAIDAKLPPLDAKKPWRLHIVHPSLLDKQLMKEWVNIWLKSSYNWKRWKYLEWPYSQIKRKVFIEEFLGGNLLLARNIKAICFHGKVADLILTHLDPSGREKADGRFQTFELRELSVLSKVSVTKLAVMVADSEALSRDTDFVRVDWVISSRGLIFGELTNFPAAGGVSAGPSLTETAKQVNERYSSLWTVPQSYNELPAGEYRR